MDQLSYDNSRWLKGLLTYDRTGPARVLPPVKGSIVINHAYSVRCIATVRAMGYLDHQTR